jgi:FG-GAP repeat
MRRRSIALILALAAAVWPAAVSSAHGVTAAQPVGSLQADFNDDGFADLAVGVPFEDVGATRDAGAVNVLYGSADGLTGAGSQLFSQGPGGAAGSAEIDDAFGYALAVGDYNNDGVDDAAVGVPFENIGAIQDAGAVNVLNGSVVPDTGPGGGLTGAGSQLFWQGAAGVPGAPGAEPDDSLGFGLAAGDFDNDGYADLAAGAPFEDVGATRDAGAVNVLYGSADKLSGTGSQLFWQGAAGVAGSAEAEDLFGFAFVGSDQSPSPSASSLRAQSEASATAPSGR